jgi:hypothetical protein
MNTTLLLFLEDEWKRVDLYEDLPITITIQELDITDFQSRKSTYSRIFTVPATSNNSNIFEHYYEVNGTEFNPLVKIPAVVQYRGTDIFNGVLRMNSVIINSVSSIDFEVYLMSDVGDFISEVKNLTLRDLDYTDLIHEHNYDNITASWSADTTDTNGLFGGQILYPMLNYGLNYQGTTGTTPDWTYRFNVPQSFNYSGSPAPISSFKPAIKVKSVIDRIFNKTSYNLNSEFFDTDYFKSIYMSMFNNGQLGVQTQTAEDIVNQNIFKAFSSQQTLSYQGGRILPFKFSKRFPGSYDPLNNFYNTNNGTFQAPYQGIYYFNLRFNYKSHDPLQIQGNFNIVVKKGTDPTNLENGFLVYQSPKYKVGFNIITGFYQGSPNLFFDVTMAPGEYIGIFIEEYNNYSAIGISRPRGQYTISPYNSIGIEDRFIQYDLYNAPLLTTGTTIDCKVGMPDTNVVTFLRDIITMFNLVVIQDEDDKSILITPYNWYFNEADRIEKDWTQRLDLNSQYRIEPLSFELPKEINFTYDIGSEEYLNKLFEDGNDYVFGRYRFVSDSNLLTGVKEYSLNFAATPTSSVLNAPNFIIPSVYREENGWRETPYQYKPHIFFWSGNRYAYSDIYKQIPGYWYLLSGATAVQQTTYPCVSHLSTIDVQIPSLVSDLSFGSTFDFFGNFNDQPQQFTQYNLYDVWWRDYIENNYSNETRRLTGRFFLKPIDIYEINFTDKIYIKDSFYRIEKIIDGNLTNNDLTQVSLIKEIGGYYKVTPPSPFYPISPNQPYPGIPLATNFTAYTGTSITSVCDGTAGTSPLVLFGSLPLNNLEEVWYDAGGYYTPLTIATYLRETGDTQTFLVIDKQGRILEQDC